MPATSNLSFAQEQPPFTQATCGFRHGCSMWNQRDRKRNGEKDFSSYHGLLRATLDRAHLPPQPNPEIATDDLCALVELLMDAAGIRGKPARCIRNLHDRKRESQDPLKRWRCAGLWFRRRSSAPKYALSPACCRRAAALPCRLSDPRGSLASLGRHVPRMPHPAKPAPCSPSHGPPRAESELSGAIYFLIELKLNR